MIFVVGDVHGCVDEVTELLARIFEESGKGPIEIWCLGDAIDKGPDSKGVLDLLFLTSYPNVIIKSIMGNHCEKFLRWCAGQDREESGGKQNTVRNKWGFEKIREYRDFIKDLPLYVRFPEYNVTLIHGGVEPKMTELPSPVLSEANKVEKNLVRVRYVSPNGRMIALGEENLDQGDKWWADVYDGRFGTIIYGHQPFSEVTYAKHAIGLDTGAVFGGKLSALRLSKDGNHKLIQVDAKQKYASSYEESSENVD